jgi:hypothetical protein
MLGFSIRTDGPAQRAEIVLASEPGLFGANGRARRTSANFFSSRGMGPVPVISGEAMFVVPPEVLARFVGIEKLYFALATAPEAGGPMQVAVKPTDDSPYISLRELTERSMRRVRILPNRQQRTAGYGNNGQAALEWAGDVPTPGMEPVRSNGGAGSPAPKDAAKPNGATPATPEHAPYDDGFGPMPPQRATPPAAPATVGLPPPPVRAQALDAAPTTITGQQQPVTAPPVRRLSAMEKALILTGLSAFSGPLGPLLQLLPAAARAASVSIGIGPTVGAGVGAGLTLGGGLIFGPDGELGVYGSGEVDIGFITSISAAVQVTVVRGGIENFNGWSMALAVSGGEGIVGGASALFDTKANFQGVTAAVGIGVGFSPVDFYIAVQRGVASELGLAAALGQLPAQQRPASAARFANSSSRALEADPLSLDVKYRMFIPSPLIDSPTAVFGGDGRGFSYDGGTSRGEIHATVRLTAGGGIAGIDLIDRQWGESTEYATADAHHVDGKPSWWLARNDGAQAINRATLGVSDDNLRISVGAPGTTRSIQALAEQASLVTIEASGSLPLSAIAPAIDADISLLIRVVEAAVQVKVQGEHDGFPCHEVYVNGRCIYSFDPVAANSSPEALLPPMNITASTGWVNVATLSTGQSFSLSNTSFTLNWDEVESIPQPSDMSCWATAAAMVIGWRDRVSLSPQSVADIGGRSIKTGLNPAEMQDFAREMGLAFEYPASYTVEGFCTLLTNNGPLFVAAAVPGLHAIVVTGLYSDGADTYVRITDPWDRTVGSPGLPGGYLKTHTTGSRYIMKWQDFVAEYERAATDYSQVNLQILHSGRQSGRVANTGGSTPVGYAQSASAAFTINWDEVELIPQPTDLSCWATAAAMVIGWRDRVCLTPATVAGICHRPIEKALNAVDFQAFARAMGLNYENPACYTVEGLRTLLENKGPLWVYAEVPFGHAIVVTGLYSDGISTFVRITDPLDRTVGAPGTPGNYPLTHATGSRYIMTWDAFMAEYEAGSAASLQILHSGGSAGRVPNTGGSIPAGYAQGMSANARSMARNAVSPARNSTYSQRSARAFANPDSQLTTGRAMPIQRHLTGAQNDVNWDLVQYDGLKSPARANSDGGQAVADGRQVDLGDWPFLPAANPNAAADERTRAPVTINWHYQGGAVGNVRITPEPAQARDGWSIALSATVADGPDTPDVAALRITVRTVFSKPGEANHIAVTSVTLFGDGRQPVREDAWEPPSARMAA